MNDLNKNCHIVGAGCDSKVYAIALKNNFQNCRVSSSEENCSRIRSTD
jgi:hypothetical protein